MDNLIQKKNTKTQKNRKTKKIVLLGILLLLLGFVLYSVFYFTESYGPDEAAEVALLGSDSVIVTTTDDYIYFKPANIDPNQAGLLYYPGAKVEPEAYSVMGYRLAEAGIPVVIVKMPLNFAIFDANKAIEIKESLGLSNAWAIGGHSLGGAMAAKFVYENPTAFGALILFASYPAGESNDLSDSQLRFLSISASLDALATREKIDAKRPFLPESTTYITIEGGNHAQFGNYGPQKGDNKADISTVLQMDQIVDTVISFLK